MFLKFSENWGYVMPPILTLISFWMVTGSCGGCLCPGGMFCGRLQCIWRAWSPSFIIWTDESNQLNQSLPLNKLEYAINRTRITLVQGALRILINMLECCSSEFITRCGSLATSAVILPILKPVKLNRKLSSYRPLTLTCFMCKIGERIRRYSEG